jgi:hypothetical protein
MFSEASRENYRGGNGPPPVSEYLSLRLEWFNPALNFYHRGGPHVKAELIARVRQEQTKTQLELVSSDITRELEEFIDQDILGLHRTKLEAVKKVLDVAVEELNTNLGKVESGLQNLRVEEVYDLCREYDQAIVWLQRLWEYLKEKFGQRDESGGNEELAQLVKSADEVVWSCFDGVLKKALGKHGSAPLAYVEPEYSPATIQTDEPLPINLTLTADLDFLNECLQSLPIPVLRLPPSCISAPWWLVLVGHEVGHHVQYALDLAAYFREGMTAAAKARGFSEEDAADSWGRWGEELFADLFSVMMMGQWALRAIAEAETGTAEKMVERKSTYPSPVVRLAFMKRVAEKLGLDAEQALLGLDLKAIADTDGLASQDYNVVEGAVSFALQPLPKFGELKELCSFKKGVFADGASVSNWSTALSIKGDLQVDPKTMTPLETARQVACGSLRAWSKHSDDTGSANDNDYELRKEKRETIKINTIQTLLKSGPRETRAGGKADEIEAEAKGKTLASLLRSAGRRTPRANAEGEAGAVQD